jgi:hypothetical protein
MGGAPLLSLVHSYMLAQTVASVGPYALMKRRPCAQRCTKPAGQASPATMSVLSSGNCVSVPDGKAFTALGGKVA